MNSDEMTPEYNYFCAGVDGWRGAVWQSNVTSFQAYYLFLNASKLTYIILVGELRKDQMQLITITSETLAVNRKANMLSSPSNLTDRILHLINSKRYSSVMKNAPPETMS